MRICQYYHRPLLPLSVTVSRLVAVNNNAATLNEYNPTEKDWFYGEKEIKTTTQFVIEHQDLGRQMSAHRIVFEPTTHFSKNSAAHEHFSIES